MKLLMLGLLLLAGCMNMPCTNTTQTIWEPKVNAWCDHTRRHEECGNTSKSHLLVEFQEAEAAILGVTTYFEGGTQDYVVHEKVNKLHLRGMFPEDMHHKMLKVVVLVAYKGRVFQVPVYCTIIAIATGARCAD